MKQIKKQYWAYYWAVVSLCGLIVLSLAWELWLAPLREGGSWLALKALPLCLPLSGILKGKVYTYQWSCLLILAYFAEAIMRLFDAMFISQLCAMGALVFSSIFFVACLVFVKQKRERFGGA